MLKAEKSFLFQFLLQCLKSHLKIPDSGRLQKYHVKLISPLFLVDGQIAHGYGLQAVLGLINQILVASAPHDTAQLGVSVFQCEIEMTGAVSDKIRDFPFDPHRRKMALYQGFQIPCQL